MNSSRRQVPGGFSFAQISIVTPPRDFVVLLTTLAGCNIFLAGSVGLGAPRLLAAKPAGSGSATSHRSHPIWTRRVHSQ